MSESSEPVLAFERVTLEREAPYECGVAEASFTLPAGGLLLVEVMSGQARTPLADLASGVIEPASGAITFRGRDWKSRSPGEASAERARIGRVFESGGWISNLDVDENITLAGRYHELRPASELMAEAEALARSLGQEEIFRARPALVMRSELRRSQWVRALLGQPALLLLERPTLDTPEFWHPVLIEHVGRARDRGAAVIWLTSDRAEAADPALKPTLHFRMRDSKLIPVS